MDIVYKDEHGNEIMEEWTTMNSKLRMVLTEEIRGRNTGCVNIKYSVIATMRL